MSVTAQQLASMEAAYYSGHKSVSFNGRTVVYQDVDALWRAIQIARQELAAAAQGQGNGAYRRMTFTTLRGF